MLCRTLVFLISITASPLAAAEPASAPSVRLFLEDTGASRMGAALFQSMLPNLKRMVPKAPDEFWEGVVAETNMEGLIDEIVPVYQKYLTQEDIDAINAFNQTPAGRKLIGVQPLMLQDSMAIGQAWGRKMAQDVIDRYKRQYTSP